MRLLLVIYGSLEQISGGYLYDRKVVEYLRDRGVEVDTLQLPILPYLLCPFHAFYAPLRRLFRGPESGRGYDCIIIDELTHPSVFLLVSRRSRGGPPLVVLLHHLKAQERIGPLLKVLVCAMERSLLRRCDGVIVNSRTTERTVRSLLERQVAVYVCPPGSDALWEASTEAVAEEWGSGQPSAGRPLRLLITGNIIPRKGHDLLIRMLAQLSDLDWELRVVGAAVDSHYKIKVDRLARRFGLEDRIVYTGVLAGPALRRQYLEADLFVFPSRYEGFGISLAEAIRAGLPFIAFASGAIPEVTGGQGVLIADGDLQSFQHCLRRLISDSEFRESSAALSRRLATRLTTWSQTGEAFLHALMEIT
ncbi:MAG: glycosyltransferase family 4 protein [Spirochaetaceae bacterium]|nr:MAG: glycosyltransferase family 4 protein [Spirochaetaceae bacterium]